MPGYIEMPCAWPGSHLGPIPRAVLSRLIYRSNLMPTTSPPGATQTGLAKSEIPMEKQRTGTDRQSGRRRAKQQDQAALGTCPVQAPVTRWRASLRPHTGTNRASSPQTRRGPGCLTAAEAPVAIPEERKVFSKVLRQLGFHIEKKEP